MENLKQGCFHILKEKIREFLSLKKYLKVAVIKCCHKPEKIVTG